MAKRITAAIEKTGAAVTHCPNLEQAENALNDLSFEAALFDLNLPDGESLDLLRRKLVPDYTLTVLMTGEGGVRSAVEALQLGAADYLAKPFDLDELPLVFANADQRRKMHGSANTKRNATKGKAKTFSSKVLLQRI